MNSARRATVFLPLSLNIEDEDDVKPGFMRTKFFGSSYKTTAPEHSPCQHLYDENRSFYMGQNGTQAGDPEKAAELYIKVAEMENP